MDTATIQKIAYLSRIKINDKEIETYKQDLSNILDLVQKIQTINTDGIGPMSHPLNLAQYLRKDKITVNISLDALCKNAPKIEKSLYLVPQIIE